MSSNKDEHYRTKYIRLLSDKHDTHQGIASTLASAIATDRVDIAKDEVRLYFRSLIDRQTGEMDRDIISDIYHYWIDVEELALEIVRQNTDPTPY